LRSVLCFVCAIALGLLTGCSGDFFPSFNRTNIIQHDVQGDRLPIAAVIRTVKCDLSQFLKEVSASQKDPKTLTSLKPDNLLKENDYASVTLTLKVATTGGVNYKQLDLHNLVFFVPGADEIKNVSAASPWPGYVYKMTGTVTSEINFIIKQDGSEAKECTKDPVFTRDHHFINQYSPLSLNTLGLDEWLIKAFKQMKEAGVQAGPAEGGGKKPLEFPAVQLNTVTLTTAFELYADFNAGVVRFVKILPVHSTPIGDYNFDRTHTIKIVLQGRCAKPMEKTGGGGGVGVGKCSGTGGGKE
jgi:hypothetical protein